MNHSSCAEQNLQPVRVRGRAWSFVVVRGRLWSRVVVRGRSCAEQCGVVRREVWGYDLGRIHTRTHTHTNKPPRAGVQTSCPYRYNPINT